MGMRLPCYTWLLFNLFLFNMVIKNVSVQITEVIQSLSPCLFWLNNNPVAIFPHVCFQHSSQRLT